MRYPLDGGRNEKKYKNIRAFHPWGVYVPLDVESATTYKCGQVGLQVPMGTYVDGYCSISWCVCFVAFPHSMHL